MLTVITDFDLVVKHKPQIFQHRLHNDPETSEVVSMLENDGITEKSIAYLLDFGAVVGFVYIEHLEGYGVFGMYIHPDYRNQGYATLLASHVKEIAEQHGYENQPLEVSPPAMRIFKRVFGDDYAVTE